MAAVPLVAVGSDEPGLAVFQVPEAGDVEPSRPAVIEGVRLAHELLDQSGDTRSHHVLAEVVTDVPADRKSTRLNSSHSQISYAVFCLKKKKHVRSSWCPTA